ncbi:MAG: hypothetical protein OEN21_12630 [Myxococcales bacterium]|nr:hypothetical protein [Myxococcales bacterium]
MAPRVVSHAYSGRQGYRIDVFEIFYERDVVSRAGLLIHEVGLAAGTPGHVDEKDRSWKRCGSYRLQLGFLAAVYYAEGSPEAYRRPADRWRMTEAWIETHLCAAVGRRDSRSCGGGVERLATQFALSTSRAAGYSPARGDVRWRKSLSLRFLVPGCARPFFCVPGYRPRERSRSRRRPR